MNEANGELLEGIGELIGEVVDGQHDVWRELLELQAMNLANQLPKRTELVARMAAAIIGTRVNQSSSYVAMWLPSDVVAVVRAAAVFADQVLIQCEGGVDLGVPVPDALQGSEGDRDLII